jgi:hypothetical protein
MLTSQFTFNVGVNAGYSHNNERLDPVSIVSRVWQEEADKVFAEDGIYVGAVAQFSKTLYAIAWGCPDGGEDTVVLTGLLNPHFLPDSDKGVLGVYDQAERKWQEAVRKVTKAVATELEQTTAYLSFQKIDFWYFQLKEKP